MFGRENGDKWIHLWSISFTWKPVTEWFPKIKIWTSCHPPTLIPSLPAHNFQHETNIVLVEQTGSLVIGCLSSSPTASLECYPERANVYLHLFFCEMAPLCNTLSWKCEFFCKLTFCLCDIWLLQAGPKCIITNIFFEKHALWVRNEGS